MIYYVSVWPYGFFVFKQKTAYERRISDWSSDVCSSDLAAFEHLYLPLMHRQGFVAPNLGERQPEASPGGFVMNSQPGLYESVLVLDYKSLYPSRSEERRVGQECVRTC